MESKQSVDAASVHSVVIRPPLPLFFTMVQNVTTGEWFRVGQPYRSKETAKSWIGFVRRSWLGHKVRLAECKVRFDKDGKPTERSRKKLSEVYNLEV